MLCNENFLCFNEANQNLDKAPEKKLEGNFKTSKLNFNEDILQNFVEAKTIRTMHQFIAFYVIENHTKLRSVVKS